MSQTEGYVYLVKMENYLKIGFSLEPSKRMEKISLMCPIAPILLSVIPGGKAKERELHKKFKNLRLNGEWFKDSKEIREEFDVGEFKESSSEPAYGDHVLVKGGKRSSYFILGVYDNDEDDMVVVIPTNRSDCQDLQVCSVKNLKPIEFIK